MSEADIRFRHTNANNAMESGAIINIEPDVFIDDVAFLLAKLTRQEAVWGLVKDLMAEERRVPHQTESIATKNLNVGRIYRQMAYLVDKQALEEADEKDSDHE